MLGSEASFHSSDLLSVAGELLFLWENGEKKKAEALLVFSICRSTARFSVKFDQVENVSFIFLKAARNVVVHRPEFSVAQTLLYAAFTFQ